MASTPEQPTPGPANIDQNIEAILAMQNAEELALTRHQRAIERMVSVLALPAFLIGMLMIVVAWLGINIGLMLTGRKPWDEPPFGWLQTGITLLGVVMTSVVVITQNRQGKLAERNAHIDLQVNLVTDQKTAKIIQLLEEMRRDSPTLPDRHDAEAEELQKTTDPAQVATMIADKVTTDPAPNSDTGNPLDAKKA